jgi:hypothetical protein
MRKPTRVVALAFVAAFRDRSWLVLRSVAVTVALAIASWSGIARAQGAGASADTAQPPQAAPADVASLDAIIHSLYDVISGPPGPRNWTRFRSLFIKGARLIPTGRDSSGHSHIRVVSPDMFVENATKAFQKEPFYENEIGRTVETFGAITQVFTAYASRRTPDGTPFARGINSMQFYYDGNRWYCVTIFWDSERPGNTIPDRYLKRP